MLYKPKFLSPAMTNETKVLEYRTDDQYEFSCICDGNEKIISGTIYLNSQEITKEFNMYPIDYNGKYNEFKFICNLNSLFSLTADSSDMSINWKVSFVGESGITVVSALENTNVVQPPVLTWKDNINNNIEIFQNYKLDSGAIDFVINYSYYYPVQYYSYEIYDKYNILTYKSKKIYSGDIRILYDNLLNDYTYTIKLYIVDSLNKVIADEKIITCAYENSIIESSFKSAEIIQGEGNYVEWSDIQSLVATHTPMEEINSTPSFLKVLLNKDQGDKYYQHYIAELTNKKQTIQLNNLNIDAKGILLCCRFKEIPIYNTVPTDKNNIKPFFQYNNYTLGIGKILQKDLTYKNYLFLWNGFNISQIPYTTGRDANNQEIPSDFISEFAWYVIYLGLEPGSSYLKIKKITSSEFFPVIGQAILGDGGATSINSVLKDGFWNAWDGTSYTFKEKDSQRMTALTSLRMLGVDNATTQFSYVCVLNEHPDYINSLYDYANLGLGENGQIINVDNVFNNLNTVSYQPYWKIGFVDKWSSSNPEIVPDEELFYYTDKNSVINIIEANVNFKLAINFELKEIDHLSDIGEPDLFSVGLGSSDKNALAAGDPSVNINFTKVSIKRKKIGDSHFKNICDLNYEYNKKYSVIDYTIKNNEEYEYYLFPYGIKNNENYIMLNYLKSSKTFKQEFDKWVLYIASENPDNTKECFVEQMLFFDLNINSGTITNNNTKTIHKNFTAYPRVQSSPHCYWSGTLKGLLGVLNPYSSEYIQTPEQLYNFKLLSLDNRRKFLKDRDGNLFEIELSGPLQISNQDNLQIDLKEKTLPWVEIDNAEDISLITTDFNQVEWLLSQDVYPHYNTNYIWDENEIWINNKFWQSNE